MTTKKPPKHKPFVCPKCGTGIVMRFDPPDGSYMKCKSGHKTPIDKPVPQVTVIRTDDRLPYKD